MEEIDLLPKPRRSLVVLFRENPLATCCGKTHEGEDSDDRAKIVAIDKVRVNAKTNPPHWQSKVVITDRETTKGGTVRVHKDEIPDLQLEVDHDHSDSSYLDDDLASHHHHPSVNVVTERAIRAYDISSVLMHLAQLLLAMTFMESWLVGGKARTTHTPKKNVSLETQEEEDGMEPIPQILN